MGNSSSIYKPKIVTSPLGRENSSNYKNKKATVIYPKIALGFDER
jgi:hypothetical protein